MTIVAETIEDLSSADSLDIETLINCAPKQWLNLNGIGTIAARDSFNSASLTDLGLGSYQHSTINAFANAGYAFSGAAGGTSLAITFANYDVTAPRTATVSAFYALDEAATALDAANVDSMGIGELA